MKVIKTIPPKTPMDMPMMDTSAIRRKFLDISYTPENPHPARTLDLYLPEEGDDPFPTLICIHGGAFVAGEKGDDQVSGFVDGVARGFAVASVEQRLCLPSPDWKSFSRDGLFPDPLFDFKTAIRFLRANSAKYGLDPERFATAGDSAGGYHAVMAALTADIPSLYDDSLGFADVDGSVQAVVDWFGVGDLVVQAEFNVGTPTMTAPTGELVPRMAFEDFFLGLSVTEHKNLAYFASPETYVTKSSPPVLFQHGERDDVVPIEASVRIAAKMDKVCPGRARFEGFPEYLHGDPRFYADENLDHIFEWLNDKLKKP
jgi:acetyl esterase/lipase